MVVDTVRDVPDGSIGAGERMLIGATCPELVVMGLLISTGHSTLASSSSLSSSVVMMIAEPSDAALDGLKNPLRVGETLSISFCSNFVFIKQKNGWGPRYGK